MTTSFFPHLYGQPKFKKEIQSLIEEDKLPNMMIFYGEEGLGKTTAAFDLAGYATVQEEDLWNQAEEWNSEDFSSDLILTAGKGLIYYLRPIGMELKIEQFRQFTEAMASFDENPHFCIIDEAQTMAAAAANALLKTFEEPKGNIHFILITHDLEALLPTIISRGERFPFFPLSEKDFYDLLENNPSKYPLRPDMSREEAYQLTEGNPGILLSILHDEGARQPAGAMAFWEALTYNDTPFSFLSQEKKGGRKGNKSARTEFLNHLRWIMLVGRDLMILSETGNENLVRCREVMERERRLAPYWSGGRAAEALKVLEVALQAVMRYINIKNVKDYILIRLIHIQKGKIK